MKIALAQTNPVIGDFEYNHAKALAFADRARQRGCDLVVFPEMTLIGYPPRDLLEKPDFIDANLQAFERLVAAIDGIGVVCGFVDRNASEEGRPLFNAAALFEDGRVLQRVYKCLLPTYDVFDEQRYFEAGQGSRPFNYKGCRMGLTICEDVWNDKDVFKRRLYQMDPVAHLVESGAELIVNLSASVFYAGKGALRRRRLAAIAGSHGVSLVYANQVGGNDGELFDGGSMALGPDGGIVVQARDFEEDLVVFDSNTGRGDRHAVADSDIEGVYRALVMGTRDYVTKCGFAAAIVGLSGGVDSALTLCIAAAALGRENVFPVFMPSRYTSPDNHEDTRDLCANLDIALRVIPIDEICTAFGRHLEAGAPDDAPDIAGQNLQARIRGTILMTLSNRSGGLVLSTGNKSELAVGYCTLYGDMNGGLAVLSDVSKTAVYALARHVNAARVIIPERVITKAPSAELKPDQTDQDDLPAYAVLDRILQGYIEEFKGVRELTAEGLDPQLVADVIRRVDSSEYKRHQAAPGLKVSSKAFGFGRRYPIAQRYRFQEPAGS